VSNKKHDWEAFYKAHQKSEMTLKDYCASVEVPYFLASRNMAAIKRRVEQEQIEKARHLLAKKAPAAAERLIEVLEQEEDSNIILKASTALLDRVGVTPKAAEVNILNVQAGQAVIAPLFSDPEMASNLKEMLGGEGEE
jgi:hypothetical protein